MMRLDSPGGRPRKLSRPVLFTIFSALTCLLLLFSCGTGFDGEINDGPRTILVDVENLLFADPGEINLWEKGPGVTDLILTLHLEEERQEITVPAGDLDGTWRYSQIEIPVTAGVLTSLEARAFRDETLLYAAEITDKREDEDFHGWEVFANVVRFRLEFTGNYNGDTGNWDDGSVSLDVSPRGGAAVTFLIDAGVTAAGEEETDWAGAPLVSAQLAVQPVLHENPLGLAFDIYYAVVDENLREKYKQGYVDPGADYHYTPWEDIWTYEEITATGRVVAGTPYSLVKYNGLVLNYREPAGAGSGYDSFLIDLTGEAVNPVGKFLLLSVISHAGSLSAPSAVAVVEIE